MKDIARKSLVAASLLAMTVILPSCESDDYKVGSGHKLTGKVEIGVSTDNGITTKAGTYEQYETVELSSDGMTLFLQASRSAFNEDAFRKAPMTRAEIVTTDSIHKQRPSFDLNVLRNGAKYGSIDKDLNGNPLEVVYDNTVKYYPDKDKWEIEHEVDWPDEDPERLDFWAYSYGPNTNFTRGADYKSFSYVGPASAGDRNDASLMEDILVAHTGDVKPYIDSNTKMQKGDVLIHFYHALAAVRFNVAEIINEANKNEDGSVAEDPINYVSVIVSGVKKDGSATYNGGMSYSWTPGETEVSYEQVLYDSRRGEGDKALSSLESRTMFIVPQALDNVKLTFRIINKSQNKQYILSTKTLGTQTWDAGYIYNYTVGRDVWGSVDIEISEDFVPSARTKKNVRVTSIASSAQYVRALVVANWCTDGNKVYKPYTGEIEYNIDDWLLASDGYYYSKRPVEGYSDSENLINSFTCPDTAPDAPFRLHLEMNIISQAVTYDQTSEGGTYTFGWVWKKAADELYNDMEKL